VYWVVLTVCGSECALYGMLVVVCVMCRVLSACRVRSWRLWVVLYELWVFCVCDCDLCVAVLERLCVCLAA